MSPNLLTHRVARILTLLSVTAALAAAADPLKDVLVLTSTNASPNAVEVFRYSTAGTLTLVSTLPTGGAGGAGGNGGSLQFGDVAGAVANFGSNTVSLLARDGNTVTSFGTIRLASGCTGPDSVAIKGNHLYVAGANCAESHSWPSGYLDGPAVTLADNSAGQIAVGDTWAAVTMKSGSVVQLPLQDTGALTGTSSSVTLPTGANDTPLGAAFWGDVLGLNPAHSANSFALMNKSKAIFPVAGPSPAYPTNAPCWLAKGPGSVWYAANSPGSAISVFFSDDQGGVLYKSTPLAGTPTDITVSADRSLLAVIYTAADNSGAHIALFGIDAHGDLTKLATSPSIGIASFNGVAISQ